MLFLVAVVYLVLVAQVLFLVAVASDQFEV